MVVKKWVAAGIVALTVASTAGITAFAAERTAAYDGLVTSKIKVAVGSSGQTALVKKSSNFNQAFAGITSGIPTGEAVTLTVMNEEGYIASDFLYYNSYAMEHGGIYPINYSKDKGIEGASYTLRAVYRRQYTYNPESLTLTAEWKP